MKRSSQMKRSILFQSGIARSEQWRMQWACRTAISVACMAFLCLYAPTKNFIINDGKHMAGPAITGAVVGMVKDRTFGSTVINAWFSTLGCIVACFCCWVIVLIVNETTAGTYDIPDYALICIIFVLCLVLQCAEILPLGRKFMVSLVPLIIISIRAKVAPIDVWSFLVDTVVASGCALVGNVIPLPIEFSSVDLQKRTSYVAYSSTALLTDLLQTFQYQSCFNDARDLSRYAELKLSPVLEDNLSLVDKSRLKALRSVGILKAWKAQHKHDKGLPHQRDEQVNIQRTDGLELRQIRKSEHRHWRKLRLTLMCAIQFKLNRGYGLGWYFTNNSCGSKFLRMELVGYLREGIADMVARNIESKFASISPLRHYLFSKYAQFAVLLKETLSIITILEEKISVMESQPEHNYIYRAFHNIPEFRHALSTYFRALCMAIESISDCLTHSDREGVHPTKEVNQYAQDSVVAIAALMTARKQFDVVYYKCRQRNYYEHVDSSTKTAYRTETAQDAHSLPLVPDVLINMNSSLFLADALCNQIQAFWSPAELAQIEACIDTQASSEAGSVRDPIQAPCWYWWLWPTSSMRNICSQAPSWAALVPVALLELFPSQVVAFRGFFPYATPSERTASLLRLKSAFAVALSMSIGSTYGVYLDRSQAFLPAFTIAFIAVGPVAPGIAMVTSLNRAVGTVVPCVVAVIMQFFLFSAGVGVNLTSGSEPPMVQQLVVGLVVVLFQIPATIVRSFPLQGYSGMCASFTICILLFAPNLTSVTAVDRIIDTFVGVVIYLTVEALMSRTYTERIVLSNMKAVYEGIDERFAGFQKNFFLFKNYARNMARFEGSHSRAGRHRVVTDTPPPCLPLLSLNGLHVEPVDAKIKAQYDLMRFLALDPGLRRPPPMPASLVEECVNLQTQAVKHLQVMYWALKSCADADTDPAVYSHQQLYHSIHRKLFAEMEAGETGSATSEAGAEGGNVARKLLRRIGAMVRGNSDIVLAYESAEFDEGPVSKPISRSTSKNMMAPTPEDTFEFMDMPSLQADAPEIAPQAARQDQPCRQDYDFGYCDTEETSHGDELLHRSQPSFSSSSVAGQDTDTSSSASDLVNESKDCLPTSPPSAAKTPKFMLLTLEKSFVKVGRYVSLVCTFLQMSLQDMEHWQEAGAMYAQSHAPTGNSLRNINTLNEARVSQHSDFLLRIVSLDAFHKADVHLLTKLETQQVVALFSGFQSVVEHLLSEVVNSGTTTVVLNGQKVRTLRQNKEVKVVNAMIASTLDLLRALKGLAATMSKLQAHRDIRVTQYGDRFV